MLPMAAQVPDLGGVYTNNDATPLERPKALEGRQFLTDAEGAELKKRADRLFKKEDNEAASGDNVFLAALANLDHYQNPSGHSTAGTPEMVERVFDNRTALIVDPPDGKIPPLTPEGRRKHAAAAAAAHRPIEGPEELSPSNRCISFGVPRLGGNFGAGVYSFYQILQTPDHIVFFMEALHEARIIPLDGRPHLPKNIRQW